MEKKVVISTEIGGGVVPVDPAERRKRESAGRLACLLAERADTVIRVCCGLPRFLKGEEALKEHD
jgi:adenosylcobinamide kinase/adenosylcobinamide-phosphate guanylyltransferase